MEIKRKENTYMFSMVFASPLYADSVRVLFLLNDAKIIILQKEKKGNGIHSKKKEKRNVRMQYALCIEQKYSVD